VSERSKFCKHDHAQLNIDQTFCSIAAAHLITHPVVLSHQSSALVGDPLLKSGLVCNSTSLRGEDIYDANGSSHRYDASQRLIPLRCTFVGVMETTYSLLFCSALP
jgi:hypothetical protein